MSMRVWVGLGRCGAACLAGVAHVRPLSGLRLAVTLGFRVPNYEYFRAAVGVRVPWRPTDENGTASKQNPNPWMNAELVELFEKFNTAFVAFDLDGDGTITVAELASATCSLGQQAPHPRTP